MLTGNSDTWMYRPKHSAPQDVFFHAIDDPIGPLKMNFAFDGLTVTALMDKHAERFLNEYIGFASGAGEA